MSTDVQIINQTTIDDTSDPTKWTLWFQWVCYINDDGTKQYGYRFIWRYPMVEGGGLQPARGQARIPSMQWLQVLVAKAKAEGWGDYDADALDNAA
jgi:hypothetical protein